MYFRSTLAYALLATTTTTSTAITTPRAANVEARNFPGAGPFQSDFPGDFNPAIATLVPTSVWDSPNAASSAISSIQAGNDPSWYTSLPSDAKSYFNSWDNNWSGGSWPTDWSS